MANNKKENKIEKFTKEAIGKTLNQFNKEIGIADLVEINKNQDRILNGILSQVNDENTEKTEKSNIITLDNSTDGIVELKEIQGDTNVNVSKIEEMPITHDIGEKEGNVFTLNEITKGAISIGEIQGNTMVNCNKDDKKELVLMKDLSTQGDNAVTLTEGVDGGLVDVALEGNTLVNVSKTKDSTALPLDEELTYLYANTQYTVQFISDKAITADITLGGTSLLAQSIVKGLNRISITTPATLVDNKLVINGAGANISEVVVTDTDREFGYFEGMKSVGECEGNAIEILSHSKNYFSCSGCCVIGEKSFYGTVTEFNGVYHYIGNSERVDGNFGIKFKDINLDKNTKYTFSYNFNAVNNVGFEKGYIKVYMDNKIIAESMGSATFTTNNSSIVTILVYGTMGGNKSCEFEVSNLQIEKGDSITNYNTVRENSQTLTHEPLRAVGDVKDRYVLIDGKWYIERKCEEVVLDGSNDENIELENSLIKDNTIGFKYYNDSIVSSSYCDKFMYEFSFNDKEHYVTNPGWVCFMINKTKLQTQDSKGFRQWLQNNPVKVIYRLATPQYEPINYNPLEVYSEVAHISTNSTIPCNITVKNHGFNCLLKPSTTYTISSNLGLNTVTTPSELTEDCLRFMDTDTSDVTTMKNVLVLEGDWTTKADLIPANFSGIESCFEQEYDAEKGKYKVNVKVVGKNLFNGQIYDGWLNNGEIVSSSKWKYSDYIQVPANTKVTLSLYYCLAEYDYNKKYIKTDAKKTIITSSNCCYIRIGTRASADMSKFQIEIGDTATAYEPYKESNIVFYINEPLRGIGDIKDRIYIKDDKLVVERNCSSEVFDGSDDENWEKQGGNWDTDKRIAFKILLPKSNLQWWTLKNEISTSQNYASKKVSSDKFTYIYTPPSKNINEFISQDGNISFDEKLRLLVIGLSKNKLQTQDVAGFKRWLQQNPITVVYQLAEPTYEEVEYSSNRLILDTFNNESFNNSTLFLDTNISPKLSFKPLWEELVYVKNSTKYYIQFNAVGSGEVVINLGGTELTTEIVEGYNCIPITTPSESTNLMTISGQGITISEVVVSEVVCGGYYKGLQSCFEEHMENGKYRVLLRGIALDGSKVNGIKLYINEPLRGIGNAKDRLCIKNGKLMVERKCGEIIVNETNQYNISSNNSNYPSVLRLFLHQSNIPNMKLGNILCDTFPSYDVMNRDVIGIGCDNGFDIHLPLPTTSTIDEAREYLKNNPLKVVYQIYPIYEEATNEYGLPIVFEGYENGIVYIDSAVTPTTHIKYTSNNQLATTLAEAEEQNISTQEDINMNVITYMMDIDMMLTDMEMSNDISVMAVRRDSSNENMLDRMSDEDKKVYRDNTVVMLEKMITANVLEKEDIERRIDMYYDKNRISKEQYKYLKSLL